MAAKTFWLKMASTARMMMIAGTESMTSRTPTMTLSTQPRRNPARTPSSTPTMTKTRMAAATPLNAGWPAVEQARVDITTESVRAEPVRG